MTTLDGVIPKNDMTSWQAARLEVTQNLIGCPWIMSDRSIKFREDLISSFLVNLLTDKQT